MFILGVAKFGSDFLSALKSPQFNLKGTILVKLLFTYTFQSQTKLVVCSNKSGPKPKPRPRPKLHNQVTVKLSNMTFKWKKIFKFKCYILNAFILTKQTKEQFYFSQASKYDDYVVFFWCQFHQRVVHFSMKVQSQTLSREKKDFRTKNACVKC